MRKGNVFTPVCHSVRGGGACHEVTSCYYTPKYGTSRMAPPPPPRSTSGTHPTGMLSSFSVIFTQKDGKHQRKESRHRFRRVWMSHQWDCISSHRGRSEHLLNLGSVSLCSTDCQWVSWKWKGQLGATNVSILNRDVQSGLSLVFTHTEICTPQKRRCRVQYLLIFTNRKRRYYFHRCLSIHRGSLLVDGGRIQTETPLCTETSPPDRDPSGESPPPDSDPQELTSSGGHCSCRYTSYWNAFLFLEGPEENVTFKSYEWHEPKVKISVSGSGPRQGVATATTKH